MWLGAGRKGREEARTGDMQGDFDGLFTAFTGFDGLFTGKIREKNQNSGSAKKCENSFRQNPLKT
jgi:hypothetical protein